MFDFLLELCLQGVNGAQISKQNFESVFLDVWKVGLVLVNDPVQLLEVVDVFELLLDEFVVGNQRDHFVHEFVHFFLRMLELQVLGDGRSPFKVLLSLLCNLFDFLPIHVHIGVVVDVLLLISKHDFVFIREHVVVGVIGGVHEKGNVMHGAELHIIRIPLGHMLQLFLLLLLDQLHQQEVWLNELDFTDDVVLKAGKL